MLKKVYKYILENGLTVLVKTCKVVPKVSTQLWYNVGSKHEKTGQRGIAHLIEHMIFKGTATLSECDIDAITRKLSGYCNAFTSFDYTGYVFDFPTQHWSEALPIMADCMRNCTFKQEFLNSELKAVIQELKLYKDDYLRYLLEGMITDIFYDHPYRYPIIGYKQDLWSLKREELLSFYNEHYIPNNATLVVVGDVDPEEVRDLASKSFSKIKPNFDYKQTEFYHSPDLRSTNLTFYRDVKQPLLVLGWTVSGLKQKDDYLVNLIAHIFSSGRGSRLYKLLVDIHELVTEIDAFNYDLFDYGILFIYLRPKDIKDSQRIIDIINQEIEKIIKHGVTDFEILRASKRVEVDHLGVLENIEKQSYAIGQYFLSTGDENFLYNYTSYPKENLSEKIKQFFGNYLLKGFMHQGQVLPIPDEQGKAAWLKLQQISDEEDQRVLSKVLRTEAIEQGKCVLSIHAKEPKVFDYPKADIDCLNNGLRLFYNDNENLPKIDFLLDFKAKHFYDPRNLQGLGAFVSAMLEEGTKNYSAVEFADVLESLGMNLRADAGYLALSLLSGDLVKGLELVTELLTNAVFDPENIERVREQLLADLHEYWDEPSSFVKQLIRDEIYKDHPYSKNPMGTLESIKKINRADLIEYYRKYLTPVDTRLSLVGDVKNYDLQEVADHIMSSWTGKPVDDIQYPEIAPVFYKEINYPMARDQVVLCYAGLSVRRTDPDYDKLLVFDQIFTGGILSSMGSRLFDIRTRTGLFYTIGGSLISNVDVEPGLIMIKTIVSNDRLVEAEKAIEEVIANATENITETEFSQAKQAIINTLVDNFSSNYKTAATFLFKDKYRLSDDYFDDRAKQILAVDLNEMKEVVKRYLDLSKMIKVRVGRV